MMSQSQSARSIGSASQQDSGFRNFDPVKTELGVPEMFQFVSPQQKTRKILDILTPKPKIVQSEDGSALVAAAEDDEGVEGEKDDKPEDIPNM
jgi:hypothetical protein